MASIEKTKHYPILKEMIGSEEIEYIFDSGSGLIALTASKLALAQKTMLSEKRIIAERARIRSATFSSTLAVGRVIVEQEGVSHPIILQGPKDSIRELSQRLNG